jgi:thiol-disulfide isomerase/thioredoxin
MRRLWCSAAGAVLVAAAVAGCGGAARSAAPSAAQIKAAFAGSPPSLQALHARAGTLLASSPQKFKTELDALRGFPVVVNKWASWCGPCRQEFPAFQRAAVSFGREVAFLGLDSFDNRGNAQDFLRSYPVTYPSYEDPGNHIANALRAGAFFPTTLFFDRTGKLAYTHQGGYASATALSTDIRRYALASA